MKYKHIILFAALALITTASSAQIQFTAGINYESGVPSGAPSSTGSRLRVDLASGRIYQWSAANTTWRTLGQGIDIVAGCAAPAYTPGYAQSVFAVNGCSTPELYYYNGTQWKQVAGGGGGGATYYAGTGIDIDANDTISIDTVPRLIFYSDQTYSGGVGAMRWNSDDGTLDLGLKGGNVTLQLGQELVQPVKHATNGGLDNGKVVYITGSTGDNKTVLYARANNEATSSKTLGVMTETVTGGNKGFCTTFGLVRNINTSNLTEGGAVWLSKDTAGAMTAVRPEAPNNGVFIGFCVRKHASTGVIFVNVQNGYELEELHNVYAPSPTNGQVLTYVSGNSRWEAATVADQSATNELQTLSVASNTATLSNSGGSVTIAGGGINTVGTAGSTITVTGTEVDGSISNELQTIDTFSLSGQTLRASLSNDNQAAKTVTLPVVGITAGTNVTVSSTGGNFTINATGGSGSPASPSGGIQFNNAGAFGASSNLFWDNTNGRLGIGTSNPLSPLHAVGEVRSSVSGASCNFTANNPFTGYPRSVFSIGNTSGDVNAGMYIRSQFDSKSCFVELNTHTNVFNSSNRNVGLTINTGTGGGLIYTSSRDGNTEGPVLLLSTQLSTATPAILINTLSNNQRVGINSTTTNGQLHVKGSGNLSSTWTAQFHNSGNANNALMVRDDGIVAMGTASPNSSARLDITSTTQGVLLPRMTTTDRGNIASPADGLTIYNTTTKTQDVYNNTRWLTGNAGLTGSATLDFGSTAAQTSSDLTITVTGAADGDVVSLGVPNASVNANTNYTAWVSATNTVTVRFNNYSSAAVDPASGTFKVFVTKFS